jgi:hypothetical protein
MRFEIGAGLRPLSSLGAALAKARRLTRETARVMNCMIASGSVIVGWMGIDENAVGGLDRDSYRIGDGRFICVRDLLVAWDNIEDAPIARSLRTSRDADDASTC